MAGAITRGVLFVHSSPRALVPHVEWAINNALNAKMRLEWIPQPAAPSLFRTELSWQGTPGTGAQLTSALRGWEHLRYEVTEEPSIGKDGARWSHTPDLGIFHAVIDVHGNIVIPENRVHAALQHCHDANAMKRELELALGKAWDDELEPFRYAGAGAPVRWLHRVG